MKNVLVFLLITGVVGVAFAVETVESWTATEAQVFSNKIDEGGWVKDEAGKVVRDAKSENLRITTSHGVFRVDLPGNKVFEIKDGKETELTVSSLFQRSNGTQLVFKTDKVKVRINLKDILDTISKYVPGLKQH